MGEETVAVAMLKKFPKAKMLQGFSSGVGIDQIWQDGDEFFVVEAKGPGAKLGLVDSIAGGGQQMGMLRR